MAGYAYSYYHTSHIILTLTGLSPIIRSPTSETLEVAHPVYTLVQVILIGKVPI